MKRLFKVSEKFRKIDARAKARPLSALARSANIFTLEYWQDDGWYVGKLREVPDVFSQGETLEELEENIEDAYRLMIGEAAQSDPSFVPWTKEIALEVA